MSFFKSPYLQYRFPVPKAFENVFTHFYGAENYAPYAITSTFMPTFQTLLIFNFGNEVWMYPKSKSPIKIQRCMVFGPVKTAFDYTLTPGAEILVISFKDDAFYRFFGNALIGAQTPSDPDTYLDKHCFNALWLELNALGHAASKIAYLLDFCRPYLRTQDETATLITQFKSQKLNPIKTLAVETGKSERYIQMVHKMHFGYSAQEITRFRRFMKTIQHIRQASLAHRQIDWMNLVHQCGYYDQSQLIKDFNYYIHISPKKYLKFQQDICHSAI